MNKAELIGALEAKLGSRRVASDALEAVFDTIIREVARGGKVGITGFGTFERADRAARTGRNPKTGQTVKIKKTRIPKFRAGTNFKEIVAGQKKLSKTASRSGPGLGGQRPRPWQARPRRRLPRRRPPPRLQRRRPRPRSPRRRRRRPSGPHRPSPPPRRRQPGRPPRPPRRPRRRRRPPSPLPDRLLQVDCGKVDRRKDGDQVSREVGHEGGTGQAGRIDEDRRQEDDGQAVGGSQVGWLTDSFRGSEESRRAPGTWTTARR